MTNEILRFSRAFASISLALLCAAACSSSKDAHLDDEAPVESQEEAEQVQLKFDGTFRNISRVYDRDLVTEIELSAEGLQQRRDGFVVFDAPCTKSVRSKRRVDFDCGGDNETQSLWPLAFTADGELFHRAMPELLYQRVERAEPDNQPSQDSLLNDEPLENP